MANILSLHSHKGIFFRYMELHFVCRYNYIYKHVHSISVFLYREEYRIPLRCCPVNLINAGKVKYYCKAFC